MNSQHPLHILLISPESWGTSFLSKHHYAWTLAEMGHQVWFLNSPNHQTPHAEPKHANLHVLEDQFFIKGLRHLPQTIQRRLMQGQIRKLCSFIGHPINIVWSFDNSRFYMLDLFAPSLTIHHVVDDHMDYHLAQAAKSAHLCLGVTPSIVARLSVFNGNSHFIPHGTKTLMKFVGQKLPLDTYTKHAAYVGNLLMKSFDASLIFELASTHQEIGFWLIGNATTNHLSRDRDLAREKVLHKLRSLRNVYFHGECSPDDAFALASEADILLSMYFHSEIQPHNSSKIMHYLSTGRTVVSNYFATFEGSSLLEMCRTREEFLPLLEKVLGNLDHYNSALLSDTRKQYAAQNLYSALVAQILDKL